MGSDNGKLQLKLLGF